MKKLLFSLVMCGSLCGATNMYASDEFTRTEENTARVLATIATTCDIASLFIITPAVYKAVSEHSFCVTTWPCFSIGLGIGAGLIATIEFSNLCTILLLCRSSDHVAKKVYEINEEQRGKIFSIGILASLIGLFGML